MVCCVASALLFLFTDVKERRKQKARQYLSSSFYKLAARSPFPLFHSTSHVVCHTNPLLYARAHAGWLRNLPPPAWRRTATVQSNLTTKLTRTKLSSRRSLSLSTPRG